MKITHFTVIFSPGTGCKPAWFFPISLFATEPKTRSIFDRYNVTSEEDLQQAASRLNQYFQKKMVTIPVTQLQLSDWVWGKEASQPIENIGGVRSQQRNSLSYYLTLPIKSSM